MDRRRARYRLPASPSHGCLQVNGANAAVPLSPQAAMNQCYQPPDTPLRASHGRGQGGTRVNKKANRCCGRRRLAFDAPSSSDEDDGALDPVGTHDPSSRSAVRKEEPASYDGMAPNSEEDTSGVLRAQIVPTSSEGMPQPPCRASVDAFEEPTMLEQCPLGLHAGTRLTEPSSLHRTFQRQGLSPSPATLSPRDFLAQRSQSVHEKLPEFTCEGDISPPLNPSMSCLSLHMTPRSSRASSMPALAPINPLMLEEFLRMLLWLVRDDLDMLITCGFVCQKWWTCLVHFKGLWEYLVPKYILPCFPEWTPYYGKERDYRIGALAAYRLLACHCFYCGKSTPWFLGVVGARVCRSCFHKRGGPVELCTVEFAMGHYGVTEESVTAIPRLECANLDEHASTTEHRRRQAELEMTRSHSGEKNHTTLVVRRHVELLINAHEQHSSTGGVAVQGRQPVHAPLSANGSNICLNRSEGQVDGHVSETGKVDANIRECRSNGHVTGSPLPLATAATFSPRSSQSFYPTPPQVKGPSCQHHRQSSAFATGFSSSDDDDDDDDDGDESPCCESSRPVNTIGALQAKDLLKPFSVLSYHFAVPFHGSLSGIFDAWVLVSNEQALRAAIAEQPGEKYPNDCLRRVLVVGNIHLASTLEIYCPTLLIGVYGAAGEHSRITISGARGALVASRYLRIENLDVQQVNVVPDTFMCCVQAEEGATVALKHCQVFASGSALRGLANSIIFVEQSKLFGITAICINDEQSIRHCANNTITYYGEWPVQVCSNPDERPRTYPFEDLNTITFDPAITEYVFTPPGGGAEQARRNAPVPLQQQQQQQPQQQQQEQQQRMFETAPHLRQRRNALTAFAFPPQRTGESPERHNAAFSVARAPPRMPLGTGPADANVGLNDARNFALTPPWSNRRFFLPHNSQRRRERRLFRRSHQQFRVGHAQRALVRTHAMHNPLASSHQRPHFLSHERVQSAVSAADTVNHTYERIRVRPAPPVNHSPPSS